LFLYSRVVFQIEFFEFFIYTVPSIREHSSEKSSPSRQFLVLSIDPEKSLILGGPGLARVLGARSFHQITDEVIERVLDFRRRRPSSTDDHRFQKSVPLVKIFDVFDLNFILRFRFQFSNFKMMIIFKFKFEE
jgi:hypothetical protein